MGVGWCQHSTHLKKNIFYSTSLFFVVFFSLSPWDLQYVQLKLLHFTSELRGFHTDNLILPLLSTEFKVHVTDT